LFSTLKSKD
jgi:Domain of Unknown Function (DUF1080)